MEAWQSEMMIPEDSMSGGDFPGMSSHGGRVKKDERKKQKGVKLSGKEQTPEVTV